MPRLTPCQSWMCGALGPSLGAEQQRGMLEAPEPGGQRWSPEDAELGYLAASLGGPGLGRAPSFGLQKRAAGLQTSCGAGGQGQHAGGGHKGQQVTDPGS